MRISRGAWFAGVGVTTVAAAVVLGALLFLGVGAFLLPGKSGPPEPLFANVLVPSVAFVAALVVATGVWFMWAGYIRQRPGQSLAGSLVTLATPAALLLLLRAGVMITE